MRFARQLVAVLMFLPLLLLAGCDSMIPANQKMMKDAIEAADQAVRSEEKVWAMLLRMEELTQRLEAAVRRADVAAHNAEEVVRAAEELARQNEQTKTDASKALDDKLAAATKQAAKAEAAAKQAEEIARRIEEKEGANLQKMLEFMRELGYKP